MSFIKKQKNDQVELEADDILIAIERSNTKSSKSFDFINAEHFMDTAVGGRAKGLRTSRGWSRHELAKRAGISTVDVSRFECQPWAVPLRVISAIAGALNIAPCELSDSDPIEHLVQLDQ